MKKFSIILIVALLVLSTVGLVACGGGGNVVTTKVTFMNGNVEYHKATCDGVTLAMPANPTKAGHTFDGWFKDAACTIAFKKDTYLADKKRTDIKVYAKFTLIAIAEYTITFDVKGGEAVNNITAQAAASIVLPAATRSNYSFKGWSTTADGNNIVTDFIMPEGNVVLYAVWQLLATEGLAYTDDGTGNGWIVSKGSVTGGEVVVPSLHNSKKVTAVAMNGFEGTSITSVVLGDYITRIDEKAFSTCTSLTSITVPIGAITIGSEAFAYCTSLISINIPQTVTTIGNNAFSACTSLTSITIPIGTITIGSEAFAYCTSLTIYAESAIESPAWVTDWNPNERPIVLNCINNDKDRMGNMFVVQSGINYQLKDGKATVIGHNNVTTVVLPKIVKYKDTDYALTAIGDFAFFHCTELTSVIIPEGVISIGAQAFFESIVLSSIIIPNSVTTIGNAAFSTCTALSSVTMNEGITSIGYLAFESCESLSNITIPNSVTFMGNGVFNACTALTSIIIPGSITVIGDSSFGYCIALTSVTILDGVTSIGGEAFTDCVSLTSITIPQSVTTIGNTAFVRCTSLTSIIIPISVTTIGNEAFSDCTSLTSIIIPISVTTIGDNAFANCTSLSISVEAASKPDGWSTEWNPDNRPVVWGYKTK